MSLESKNNNSKHFLLPAAFSFLVLFMAAGNNVLAADTYEIDPVHSSIGFAVKHLVVSTVKGDFTEFSGTIIADEKDLNNSSVKVAIKAPSINTSNAKRDDHLRAPDFFDVKKYPEITFTSKKVKKQGKGYVLEGTFTMHGVSKEIAIPFAIAGPVKNPWGKYVIGIEGGLTIDRRDYGLTFNKALEGGGLLIGHEVKIELNIEAVRK
ncbi:YceI family protein [Fibrobacterota bacterium]